MVLTFTRFIMRISEDTKKQYVSLFEHALACNDVHCSVVHCLGMKSTVKHHAHCKYPSYKASASLWHAS